MGDVGCFSTYVAHLVTTGVGGMSITSDPVLVDVMRSLANHGRDNRYISIDDDKDLDEEQHWEVVQRRYRFNRIGFSYRQTELEAALGLGQLETVSDGIRRRQEIAASFRDALAPFADRVGVQTVPADRSHAYMVFGCVCQVEGEAQRLTRHLESYGVETRPLFPLLSQPAYRKSAYVAGDAPVADRLARNGFYIGCHPYLTNEDVAYVAEVLRSYFEGEE
jgi:dTDP-4-amino-4,6-dideoxygalactose transaminase